MVRGVDRPESRRDTWLPVACLSLAVAALFLPDAWGYRIADALRDTVLRPLLWLQENAAEGRAARGRLVALQAQRDSLLVASRDVGALAAENERLRLLLALGSRVGPGYVAADVLHQSVPTDGRMLTITAGAAAGARAFHAVVAPDGLVGAVVDLGEHSSAVMTWAHPDFRASAMSADGRLYGIVAPGPAPTAAETSLEFRAISYRDTVPDGTPIVTSGLGGVYPRGVPIGRTAGLLRESEGWERVYRVEPAVRLTAVGHVLLLRADSAAAAGRAWPGPPEVAGDAR